MLRSRDCAGGTGPAVEAPRVEAADPVVAGAPAVGAVAAVVVGAWELDDVDEAPKAWGRLGAG